MENIVRDLFKRYDEDNSKSLDPKEFKTLMTDLQGRMGFPPDEIYRFLAEADQNADGMIESPQLIVLFRSEFYHVFMRVEAKSCRRIIATTHKRSKAKVRVIYDKQDLRGDFPI